MQVGLVEVDFFSLLEVALALCLSAVLRLDTARPEYGRIG